MIKKTIAFCRNLWAREINYHQIRPTHLVLVLTYRCTSRCTTCVMWQRPVSAKELTLAQWQAVIDKLAPYKIKNVEMFGGDALLRKEVIFPLTRYIKRQGIPQVDLVTNGNLVDQSTARAIIESGIDVVYVSIDGVGELHDTVRGVPGSFKNIEKAVAFLREARGRERTPKLVANCTVSALNIRGFEQVADFAEANGFDVVAFEYVGQFPPESIQQSTVRGISPDPYFIAPQRSLLLNNEQAFALKQTIKAIKRKVVRPSLRIVTKNIDILRVDNLTAGRIPNKRCYVCRYLIMIDPYGNILPCPFFSKYSLGNISEHSFDKLWNNERHQDFIRAVGKKNIRICRHCIIGVERNATIMQETLQALLTATRRGMDE